MTLSRRSLVALAVSAALAGASMADFSEAASNRAPARAATPPGSLSYSTDALPSPRSPSAADRYAPANGCFTLRSVASGKFVARTPNGVAASGDSGEPFRFQAMDLGKYLLLGSRSDFLATADDPLPTQQAAALVKGFVLGAGDERFALVTEPVLKGLDQAATVVEVGTAPLRAQVRGDRLRLATQPSAAAEWVLNQVGSPAAGTFVLQQAYDDGAEETPGPAYPPIAATVTVTATGALSASAGTLAGRSAQFRLQRTSGCAAWAESQVNVSGPVAKGTSGHGPTQGYLDAHLHLMSFEFLGGRVMCGRVWHPYGVTKALVDCPDHTATAGRGALLEDFLSGNTPGTGHDTAGWPTFGYWPRPNSLTHQQVYWPWLQRAWAGGLRMMTNLLVENGQLCEVYPLKKNSCDEMESVRREAVRSFEFQRFIDAQNGGPGRGWFRVVTDPFQARRVMNQGRLAVVLGIEVSRPLGCREYLGASSCSAAEVDRRMQEVFDLGVRQMEMTNKFDNAFTGVTGDAGPLGVLINAGNNKETGHFWKMSTCVKPFGPVQQDKEQYNLADQSGGNLGRDPIFGAILATTGPSGALPAYPPGPHCNTIGLTSLGKRFLDNIVKHGMIFDPDHMSAVARAAALANLAQRRYSGVISSHSWADDVNYYKVLSMGGVVTPHAGGSSSFLGKWAQLRKHADPRFLYGVGWGSDISGFSKQGSARNPAAGKGVRYPFTALGGVTVDRQRTGQRTWDINTDGVAHYGLYPDWVQDIAVQAGSMASTFRRDLANGAEAYVQMWERATGIAGNSCRSDVPDVTKAELRLVRRGMTVEQILVVLGQPHARAARALTYCVAGKATAVRLTSKGRAA